MLLYFINLVALFFCQSGAQPSTDLFDKETMYRQTLLHNITISYYVDKEVGGNDTYG
jgi:hypothetical protein